MLANNPHLQKKRNSKKGIGRTLMRRITEIPETVSRQYSREDRDGSEHVSNRNTLRRNSGHGGKAREESFKSKVFSLKRSHSYDHTPEQGQNTNRVPPEKFQNSSTELSLLETLIGRRSGKKNSEVPKVGTGASAESVPLVCKSISAHNLAADKKPIHLRSSVIQKSLSVIASARERTLGLGEKTHSVEDASKKVLKGKDTRKFSEVNQSPECFPKMIISQSVEYNKTPSKMGIMKQQVSGSQPSICSEPGRNKDLYDLSEVCPWEMEDLPTPSVGKSQKHVSIAPSNTNTVYESSTKTLRCQQRPRLGVSSPSVRYCSRDKGGNKEDGCDNLEGREPKSPLNSTPYRSDVCPWEFDNQSLRGVEFNDKPRMILSDISKSTGSLLHPTASMAEVCPWDYEQPPSPKRRDTNSRRKDSCSSKGKGKDKEEVKHRCRSREQRSSSSRPSEKLPRAQDGSQAGGRRSSMTDGKTPWEEPKCRRLSTEDPRETSLPTSSALAGVTMAEVCLWDCDDEGR